MGVRSVLLALCVACLTLLGCDSNTTSPTTQLAKPAVNDVQLLAPQLQFVPCDHCVGVAWQLESPTPSARVTIDVNYYDIVHHESAQRPRERSPAELQGDTWTLISTQRIGTELPGDGTCPWIVPDLACDQAVLTFTVTGAVTGNDVLVRNFFVGEVRAPARDRIPQHIE